eukprot:scaffold4190_cov78-Skeletonema_marinoi.AAC.3
MEISDPSRPSRGYIGGETVLLQESQKSARKRPQPKNPNKINSSHTVPLLKHTRVSACLVALAESSEPQKRRRITRAVEADKPRKGEEGEENENDTNAKKDDTPIEQGNVAELFDNFDDINDVLDLEEDEPVIAREGEDSTSANAMLDSNEAGDGIDIDNIEGNTEQGEDNETTEENDE